MNSLNLVKTSLNQKDIVKGQKIVAAVYMVTNHLDNNEPLKTSLRSLVLSFVQSDTFKQKEIISYLDILLGSSVISGLISEKNSSIIIYEARRFCDNLKDSNDQDLELQIFNTNETKDINIKEQSRDIKKTEISTYENREMLKDKKMSFIKKPSNKGLRQNKILSLINDKKSAVIKDITSLFPEVSEKTVQRELNSLIEDGRIIKRGSKRWSIYMAVNSLL